MYDCKCVYIPMIITLTAPGEPFTSEDQDLVIRYLGENSDIDTNSHSLHFQVHYGSVFIPRSDKGRRRQKWNKLVGQFEALTRELYRYHGGLKISCDMGEFGASWHLPDWYDLEEWWENEHYVWTPCHCGMSAEEVNLLRKAGIC